MTTDAMAIFERVTRLADNLASAVPITAAARQHIDAAYATLLAMREPSPQVTTAMDEAGAEAERLWNIRDGKPKEHSLYGAIHLAMNAAREPSPQGAPDHVAEGVVTRIKQDLAVAEGAGVFVTLNPKDVRAVLAALTRQPVSPKGAE